MAIEGALVSKKFINLLIRQAIPANAQLVLVDSLTGDILYPYDVSNYYGNAEMGFVDIDGELYFANQSVPKAIPGNQGSVFFDGSEIGAIQSGVSYGTGRAYEFNINPSVISSMKDSDSTRTRLKKDFDPSDPNTGWSLEWIQYDDLNDPPGPPLVHPLNRWFVPTFNDILKKSYVWTFRTFEFDPPSGKVSFHLMFDDIWALPVNADYLSAPGADPSCYLRFTWDVTFVDQVRNIPKTRSRYNMLMGRLPQI